jgi:preprotein translocase subunit SecD
MNYRKLISICVIFIIVGFISFIYLGEYIKKNTDSIFSKNVIENIKYIKLYIVNNEETEKFINTYRKNNAIIDEYVVPDKNWILSSHYDMEFYQVVNKEFIVGDYIVRVEKSKHEPNDYMCFLNDIGSELFYQFTSENIGNVIAIVFNNEIIQMATITSKLKEMFVLSLR